jgi:hypothetical protein
MPISEETARKIDIAYREVEVGEKLLSEINQALSQRMIPDIRDDFGRQSPCLQLGIPSGNNSHRLFNVEWSLSIPIIEAHVAKQRAIIAALSEKARTEIEATQIEQVAG